MLALLLFLACSDVSLTPVPDTDLDTDVTFVYIDTDHDSDTYIKSNVEVFEYFPPPEEVDIIMVLDGSGSMSNNWDSVFDQIPTMATALQALNLDWRFTTVSADPTVNTSITNYITPFSTNVEWDLYGNFLTIQALPGMAETGLQSSFLTAANAANASYFRPEADLLWIFMSDEDDQSVLSTTEWLDLWQYFKTDGAQVMATSIVAILNTDCYEAPGDRYITVSNQVINICEGLGDWSTVFKPVEDRLTYQNLTYQLVGKPIPNTIEVWVGISQSTDWTYDQVANTITLTKEPDHRTDVVVHYFPE